ncbi:hypothetical protein ABT255_18580 [Streptomyces mirabilis]|uniref:hypothetical protein n=1 Tax=Streptomyces mirabilis TaxID=68239 RepID=UPI0033219720
MDVFARILRQRAVEPESVRDVDAAWDAFGEFLQVEVEGIERLENDGDGFIVEWGRWGWNDDQPSMSFGRLLAVNGADDRDAPDRQPEYWKVELQLVFGEDPAWAALDSLGHQDTGSTTTRSACPGLSRWERCAGSSSLTPSWRPCGEPSPFGAT